VDRFEITDWYLWPCQAFAGDFNMVVDHLLAREYGRRLDKPLLRFFTWNPYCISLGYHQKATDISRKQCIEKGIDLVRRPTGGRAILHAEELTYSVIYPFNNRDVSQFYKNIHIPFVQTLNQLGIPASFEKVQPDFRSIYKTDRSLLCFATSAKHEVEIDGKKLIGSAQRIYENAILQHGSLLIGAFHEEIVNFLEIQESARTRMKRYIQEHTGYLNLYQNTISLTQLSREISEEFRRTYDIHFTDFSTNPFLASLTEQMPDTSEFAILQNRLMSPGKKIQNFSN
jgi:lipoate-protein ligase A